jgi:hypothetical protein
MTRKLLVIAMTLAQIAVPALVSDASFEALQEAGHWKRLQRMAEPQAADKEIPNQSPHVAIKSRLSG